MSRRKIATIKAEIEEHNRVNGFISSELIDELVVTAESLERSLEKAKAKQKEGGE